MAAPTVIFYCLLGKRCCRTNMAHGPEFDTYALGAVPFSAGQRGRVVVVAAHMWFLNNSWGVSLTICLKCALLHFSGWGVG